MCFNASECFACMNIYALFVCSVPLEIREGVRSPENGVTDNCELPCVCWESNQDPLEKQ